MRRLLVGLMIFLSLGFRVYPGGMKWDVSVSDPKIWLDFCSRPNIGTNDLPSNDPLADTTLTFDTAVTSVISDFNNLSTVFLTLADTLTDPEFNSTLHSRRKISICFESTGSQAGGVANFTYEGDQFTGCTITISPSELGSGKSFIRTMTHELGHCLGLDHPQETTHAIMSYYVDSNITRLQQDDIMGLTYLYPSDPNYSNEQPTLGLSCVPAQAQNIRARHN